MATRDLTEATFDQALTDNDIVIVDWWAEWCGPCRMFAPVFKEASERHDDVLFAKVDTEAERGLAAAARIRSIPTVMIFRESILVFSQPGVLPAAALDDLLDKVRALDMEEIRAEIAKAAEPAA